jgi:pimeloyl-ACP methyl ester carboxylesterase
MKVMTPVLHEVLCASPIGLHQLAYWEWLPEGRSGADLPVVVCVHGLTRNARDFDRLAQRLATRYRVICPDMAGRGRSQWLGDPALYAVPQYVADCVTLIARLDVERIAWVGTSMGGLIGMSLAALGGSPITTLVLNDIGPVIDRAGLARIGSYVGQAPSFERYEDCVAYTRQSTASFGPHDDEGWDVLSRHYWVQRSDGRWYAHYDPRIAEPFKAWVGQPALDLWSIYEAVRCPTLLVRGAQSDLLTAEVARAMSTRGPRARLVEFSGVGHAPSFIPTDQIDVVDHFLREQF